jgi:hypothetical protein
MNPRERFLAILLIVLISLGAGGFLAWQFVYSPWKKHNESLAKLHDEIGDLENKRDVIEQERDTYEKKTRKRSLPADLSDAKVDYTRFLEELLRKAGFASPVVKASEPSTQNVPVVSGKKTAYTKLDFSVDAEGDLLSLVDFMHSFYRQPLLHQIRKVRIIKPTSSRGPRGSQDLKVTFTVEALVLDRAENRPTLMATVPSVAAVAGGAMATAHDRRSVESGFGSPFMAAGTLARMGNDSSYSKSIVQVSQEEYRRITGKNIFFGPPPPESKRDDRPQIVEIDLGPFLGLTRISHSEGWAKAMIFDRYHKEEYEIEVSPTGVVTVQKYWYESKTENGVRYEQRRKYADGSDDGEYNPKYLSFGSEDRGNLRKYVVRRVLENELVLQEYDYDRVRAMREPVPAVCGGTISLAIPGKLLHWRVGSLLKPTDESIKGLVPYDLSREARAALLRPLELDGEVYISDTDGKKSSSKKER